MLIILFHTVDGFRKVLSMTFEEHAYYLLKSDKLKEPTKIKFNFYYDDIK
jgi:hypothetical protein